MVLMNLDKTLINKIIKYKSKSVIWVQKLIIQSTQFLLKKDLKQIREPTHLKIQKL